MTRCDAVVPCMQDGWQPLFAAPHRRCQEAFERAICLRRLGVVKLLEEIHPDFITLEGMAVAGIGGDEFVNMNTPQEWSRLAQSPKDIC